MNTDAIHEAILDARASGLELRLERQWRNEQAMPHLARRLIENHLGQRHYETRIEISLFGEIWTLKNCSYRDGADKTRVENTLARATSHIKQGKLLNLEHWTKVIFSYM